MEQLSQVYVPLLLPGSKKAEPGLLECHLHHHTYKQRATEPHTSVSRGPTPNIVCCFKVLLLLPLKVIKKL